MNILSHFKNIKAFVMDIDGVLTNGQVYIQENGTLLRAMNIKDGYAVQLAVKKGYHIVVISGASSEPCKLRLQALGVVHVYLGVKDKAEFLKEKSKELKILLPECIYIGDDMPDLEVMKLCGLRACPQDSCPDIKMIADYTSEAKGGEGCIRDIIEKVMKVRGDWE
ncbi:MAG: HAD-IIIA family hydrolase [Taibaiella sp.]|nr:HAD-IIIA family hydrolase [Taibaiella sp.]